MPVASTPLYDVGTDAALSSPLSSLSIVVSFYKRRTLQLHTSPRKSIVLNTEETTVTVLYG